MRCIPIAVFCINKSFDTILEVASIDSSLTHYSERVQLITGIYCCIISRILSLRIANEQINMNDFLCEIYDLCLRDNTVLEWFNLGIGLNIDSNYDCIQNEGHVKHAFVLVIYFLKNIEKFTYEKALIEIFKRGGDTDTNGKIVGNLFGAYYGECVPKYMSDIVLNFDCTSAPNFFKRPAAYGVKYGIRLIKQI